MKTGIDVNLKEHFVKRFNRFVNIFAGAYYDKRFGHVLDMNNKMYTIDKKIELTKEMTKEQVKTYQADYNDAKYKQLNLLKTALLTCKHKQIPKFFVDWFKDIKTN